MASLHVREDGIIYECSIYDTLKEATPNVSGGSFWPVFDDNGDVKFLGLWPASNTSGGNHSPLKIRKNGITYWVEMTVEKMVSLLNYASENIDDYENISILPPEIVSNLSNIVVAEDASCAFDGSRNLTSLSGVETTWDMSNVTNMHNMFSDCHTLTSLDLSSWDTKNVQRYYSMFYNCTRLQVLDLSNFDTTKMNTSSSYSGYMFQYCSNLKYIIIDSPTFKFQKLPTSHGLNNTCKILVPQNLLSQYTASSSGWYAKRSQFDAIENYTIARANGQVFVSPR